MTVLTQAAYVLWRAILYVCGFVVLLYLSAILFVLILQYAP